MSDFSFVGFTANAALGTDCTNPGGVYSGCMTTACYDDELGGLTCVCPTWNGPFQTSHTGVSCDIEPKSYSAAYNPNPHELPIPTPPENGCIPDAGASSGNPIACPLYSESTALPPDSRVDCATVCEQYNACTNDDGIQVAYTCDATICTTQDKSIFGPSCQGLQGCALAEAGVAEIEGKCSCCGSQICDCTPNAATSAKIGELNGLQVENGDKTQCQTNGTLCGAEQ